MSEAVELKPVVNWLLKTKTLLLKFWKILGEQGIKPGMEPKLLHNITVSNYVAFGHIFTTFPYYWILKAIGATFLSYIVFPLTAFFALLPLVNRFGFTTLSRVILLLAINFSVYLFTASMGMQSSVQNVFFFTLISPLMLFQMSEWRSVLFTVSQPILFWALLIIKGGWIVPQTSMTPWAYAVMAPSISFTTAILLFACSIIISLSHQNSETKLVKAKELAEQSSKAKDEFLATMSHEIRTPLNGLLGMIQILQDSHLSNEQNTHLKIMKSSGDLLLTILNDILDFSKIESGKLDIESRVFNLKETLESGMSMIEKSSKDKKIVYVYNCARFCRIGGMHERQFQKQ